MMIPRLAVATPPRMASMWIWNIARELFLSQGYSPVPPISLGDSGIADLKNILEQPPEPGYAVCHKTHRIVPLEWGIRIITCTRDIREAIASWMRFGLMTYDKAVRAAAHWMMHCDYYLGANGHPNLLRLQYSDVVADPKETIKSIAGFIGIAPCPGLVEQLYLRYERSAIRQYMAHWAKPVSGRAMDRRTGFQTGHIAPEGYSWRTALSESEQKRINLMSKAWRERHNIAD